MATNATVAKRKRTAKRNIVLRNVIPACEQIVARERNDEVVREALVLLQALQESIVEIRRLEDAVSDLIEDEEELENHEKEAYEFVIKARNVESELQDFVSNHKEDISKLNHFRGMGVKLPKIKIKTFNGDATEWRTFIEAFDATIHARIDITNIEKFTYLKGFLNGSALQTIDGLPLVNDNYVNARDMLQKRYGNPQLIVSSRMNSLFKLPKIVNANAKDLRELYNKVVINIRALNSAGVNSEHFGAMLIPIVLEKLPNIVRLQISRKLGSDNWNITEFMNSINDEISARENFEFLRNTESFGREEQANERNTTSSLTVMQSYRLCVFCGDKNHFSDKCDVITDISTRKEKLRDLRCCYKCLKPYHIAKNCRKKIFCYKCKAQNRHNTAICEKEFQTSATNVTGSDKSVILQTANGLALEH